MRSLHYNAGHNHGQSKLSAQRVEHIRKKEAQGWHYGEQKALAKKYGVSIVTIYCVRKYLTYK